MLDIIYQDHIWKKNYMDKNDKIIGKGTWIDKLALEMIDREKQIGRNIKMMRVESGLGASGIPHIGSLGDAVRAYGVKLAIENFGYKSELITYSDDMDGLRSIPKGFPEYLKKDIGKTVSTITDPFGCHDSYGMHMSSLLLDGLDKLGIKYIFKNANEIYKKNLLQNEIDKILSNHVKIGLKIKEITGQTKYNKYLPYFPVCDNCGKIYTTTAYEYIIPEKKVKYQCNDSKIGNKIINGCKHEGESSIINDLGKLAWKVEFAARWKALDIRFEAYGKDIMSSVSTNDWVSDIILRYKHPYHVKYEMFLDKTGKKISKSSGNVVTHQNWLRYGTVKSILLLLYKRITGSRELGLSDIPSLMCEYNDIENIFFGDHKQYDNQSKIIKLKGLYEYVNLLNPPENKPHHIDYRLLVKLSKIFKENRINMISKKLIEYGIISNSTPHIENLINMAGKYADDFELESIDINLDYKMKNALNDFAKIIIQRDNEDIKNIIYNITKTHGIKIKDFFKILYQIILSSNNGPKINKLINDIGRQQVVKNIYEQLNKNEK